MSTEASYMREVAQDAFRLAGKDKVRILNYIERAERMEQFLRLLLNGSVWIDPDNHSLFTHIRALLAAETGSISDLPVLGV